MNKLRDSRRRVMGSLVTVVTVVTWLTAAPLLSTEHDSPLVDSQEYKLLLQVDRFADSARGVDEFWQGVRKVAEGIQLPLSGSVEEPDVRLVRFFDTSEFDLRENHGYVFREKIELNEDESKKKNKKITLKYRGTDAAVAQATDVSSTAGQEDDREEKLEEDVVPPRESKFSHSGEAEVKTEVAFSKISDITGAFPGLAALPIQDEDILVVNGFQAYEIKIGTGKIRLADGHKADVSFTFWYDESAAGSLLAAEFSYDFELDKNDTDDRQAAMQGASRLFLELQRQLHEWLDESAKTKTDIAYSYNPK